MATNPLALRVAVKRAIAARVEEWVNDNVTVSGFDPGNQLQDRHIFFPNLAGSIDYAVMARTEMPHDDQFTLTVVCWVYQPGALNADEAEDECVVLADAVNRAVSDNPSLEDMDGLFDILVGNIEGPVSSPMQEGYYSACQVEIACHTRVVNP